MNDEYLRNATNDLRIHTATPFHQNDATPQRRHLKNFSVIFPQQENFDVSFWRRFRIFDRSCPPPKSSQTATAVQDGVFGTSEGNKLVFSFDSCVAGGLDNGVC